MTEGFNFQWSIKSPAGGMLNIRTERADEMEMALESIASIIPAMLAVEQSLMGAGNVAAGMPLSGPQQQNAAQQYTQPNQPTQPAAQPQYQQQAPQQYAPQQPQQYAQPAQQPAFPQQGPNNAAPPGPAPLCLHNLPAKWVKPGVSQSSGRPYKGFWACAQGRDNDCGWKP